MPELPDPDTYAGRVVVLGIFGRLLISFALGDDFLEVAMLYFGLWFLHGALVQVIAYQIDRVIAHVHLSREYGSE